MDAIIAEIVKQAPSLAVYLYLTLKFLAFLSERDKAWQRHDSKQAKKCHDSQRDMGIVSLEMTLMMGRLGGVIDSLIRGHQFDPNGSIIAREKEIKEVLKTLREDQVKSIKEDEEDSTDDDKGKT